MAAGIGSTIELKLPASAMNDLVHGAGEAVKVALGATGTGGTRRVATTISPLTT